MRHSGYIGSEEIQIMKIAKKPASNTMADTGREKTRQPGRPSKARELPGDTKAPGDRGMCEQESTSQGSE
jgi:hypothetical protein